jgi:RND family efflux transporter MFP subunit
MNSPSQPGSRPHKTLWFFVCIGILAVGFVVMNLLRAFAPTPQQVPATVNIPQVQIEPLRLRSASLQVTGHGFVVPVAEITVSAQVSGEVVAIHPEFKTGGRFDKGETLLQIDPRSYRAALDEALATLEAEQSNLQLLERQLQRSLALREGAYVDENTVDDLRSRRDQSLASLKRQQANVQLRQLDLERTAIVAPFDGYILSRNIDVGSIASPGMELARLHASDNVEVTVSLSVNDAAFLPDLWNSEAKQRPASLVVEFGNRYFTWDAYIDRVEAGLDRDTRTVNVVVRVDDARRPGRPVDHDDPAVQISAPPLLVGMYARAEIQGMQLDGHFVLPVDAVHDGTIWILEAGNRLRVVPVQVVRQEAEQYVLLSPGLVDGTPVITSNLALASDGMQVRTDGAVQ